MHFSIPETEDLQEKDGSYFLGYHIYINGNHHCTLRYKQLRHLHDQLKRIFSVNTIPEFPSKRFLPLSPGQAEERRLQLEKYVQSIAQDQRLSNIFHSFLRLAQNETYLTKDDQTNIQLSVTLPGGEVLTLPVQATQQTSSVIKGIFHAIGASEDYAKYFGLFVSEISPDHNQYCLIRRLLNYESPYLAQKLSSETSHLVLRKSYWDPSNDDELLKDPVVTKLLFNQFGDDLKQYWIQPSDHQTAVLKRLMAEDDKHEVVKFARELKYYGSIFFLPCLTDFPTKCTPVTIYTMSKELVFIYSDQTEKIFRVTRIKSWRITTIPQTTSQSKNGLKLELSFEYLLSKDCLQWITVDSYQVIFLSLCLQSMVEELMRKQHGCGSGNYNYQQLADEVSGRITYMDKDGTLQNLADVKEKLGATQSIFRRAFGIKESARVRFRNCRDHSFEEARIENHAFDDIRDEDL